MPLPHIPDNLMQQVAEVVLPRSGVRKKNVPDAIYVIGPAAADSPVKIGIAVDVALRLRGLQAGSPVKLVVHYFLVTGPITQELEATAHVALYDRRSHGEWFDVTARDAVALVQRLADEMARRRLSPRKHRRGESDGNGVRVPVPGRLRVAG